MLPRTLVALLAAAVLALAVAGKTLAAAPYSVRFGSVADTWLAADFDGDRRVDPVVWSPGPAGQAKFTILRSSDAAEQVIVFGQNGDDPSVIGDYDGDGQADAAVYRAGASGEPSHWIYRPSSGGNDVDVEWGESDDFPVPGDFDGDGKMDFAVQRDHAGPPCAPTGPPQNITPTADFHIRFSGGAPDATIACLGLSTDMIVPGDYDGDGLTDIAIVRAVSNSLTWTVRRSSDLAIQVGTFGNQTVDILAPADYDGDGRVDLATWRASAVPGASAFLVHPSSGPPNSSFPLGQPGDYPLASSNIH